MNIRNRLVHATVRIETSWPDGEGSGTGFFMDFCTKENARVLTIVTNLGFEAQFSDRPPWHNCNSLLYRLRWPVRVCY
jgi:hypothetical protein